MSYVRAKTIHSTLETLNTQNIFINLIALLLALQYNILRKVRTVKSPVHDTKENAIIFTPMKERKIVLSNEFFHFWEYTICKLMGIRYRIVWYRGVLYSVSHSLYVSNHNART